MRSRDGIVSPTAMLETHRALLSTVLLALGCGAGSDASGQDPPGESAPARHAILITADAWRADHFAAQRAGVPLTPQLDEHAAGALRFTDASSAAASTAPGVASLLSGLAPRHSRVLRNEHHLPNAIDTLATVLKVAGFETAAFVSNPVLRPGRGFERGFGHYERIEASGGRKKARAEAVNERALAWLDAAPPGARLFLWIHYMEPHGPYEPPEEPLALFDLEAFEAEREVPLQPEGRHGGRGAIPFYQQRGVARPGDARDYLRRYAAEVRALDTAASALLSGLEARGVLERAVWVLTSDHGEALDGDHGYWFGHDTGVTRDQLRVPLLLHHPGVSGRSVDVPVATVDVMPTLLTLLGLELPSDLDGISLLSPRERLIFARSRREEMVRRGRFKLRVAPATDADSGASPAKPRFELFDLEADPDQLHDLAAEHPQHLAELRNAWARAGGAAPEATTGPGKPPDADTRERLEALGYGGLD